MTKEFLTSQKQLEKILREHGWANASEQARKRLENYINQYNYTFIKEGFIRPLRKTEFKTLITKIEYLIYLFDISNRIGDELFPIIKSIEQGLNSALVYVMCESNEIRCRECTFKKANFDLQLSSLFNNPKDCRIKKLSSEMGKGAIYSREWLSNIEQRYLIEESKPIKEVVFDLPVFYWLASISFSDTLWIFSELKENHAQKVIRYFMDKLTSCHAGLNAEEFHLIFYVLSKVRNMIAHSDNLINISTRRMLKTYSVHQRVSEENVYKTFKRILIKLDIDDGDEIMERLVPYVVVILNKIVKSTKEKKVTKLIEKTLTEKIGNNDLALPKKELRMFVKELNKYLSFGQEKWVKI